MTETREEKEQALEHAIRILGNEDVKITAEQLLFVRSCLNNETVVWKTHRGSGKMMCCVLLTTCFNHIGNPINVIHAGGDLHRRNEDFSETVVAYMARFGWSKDRFLVEFGTSIVSDRVNIIDEIDFCLSESFKKNDTGPH